MTGDLSLSALLGIFMVFAGCCTNVIFLEFLTKEISSCGNIVTYFQFMFIASLGFVWAVRSGRLFKPVIPLSYYVLMVIMFFVVQVVNNMCLNYNISMPLHMIFRSGSLMANLILGVIILKRSYSFSKYASVVVITIGIAVCTVASVSELHKRPEVTTLDNTEFDTEAEWIRFKNIAVQCLGIAMLIFALFMSARMGIFQEQTYQRFGKHPNEALFFNHFLPLPGFLLLAFDINRHAAMFTASDPLLDWLPIPRLWLYLLGNVVSQYVCIRGVFILTTECSSLTVSLVVTLRKFVSLLFSIFYFQNPFTAYHWFGAACVFGGTLVFTETHVMLFGPRKKAT